MKTIEVLEFAILAVLFWFVATLKLPTREQMKRAVVYHMENR